MGQARQSCWHRAAVSGALLTSVSTGGGWLKKFWGLFDLDKELAKYEEAARPSAAFLAEIAITQENMMRAPSNPRGDQ
jgi:hypothetical protein